MSTYQHIAQYRAHVPVRQLCQVLGVAPSAYYAWQRRPPSVPEPAWQVAVRNEFAWHSARYGTRRLRAELHAQGHRVGRWRIRRTLGLALFEQLVIPCRRNSTSRGEAEALDTTATPMDLAP